MIQKFYVALVPNTWEYVDGTDEIRVTQFELHHNRRLYPQIGHARQVAHKWIDTRTIDEQRMRAFRGRYGGTYGPAGETPHIIYVKHKLPGVVIETHISLTPAYSTNTLDAAYEHCEAMSVMWAEKALAIRDQRPEVEARTEKKRTGLVTRKNGGQTVLDTERARANVKAAVALYQRVSK